MQKTVLITGGCGFIGHHFVGAYLGEHKLEYYCFR